MMTADTSSPGPKPTIIDLDAEQVIEEEARKDAPDPPPQAPPAARRSWRTMGILALMVAAAIAGGWIYKDMLARYFPSDEVKAAVARVDVLEAQSKTLNDQLTAIANQSEELRGSLGNAVSQSDEAIATVRTLSARTADGETRVAAVENSLAELKTALDAMKSAPAVQPSAGGDAAPALAALAGRVEALEKEIAALKAARPSTDIAERNAALSQALSDLKAKIAAGTGYQPEYDRIARLVPSAAGLEVLGARAAAGLPDGKGLAQELRAAIPSLPQPAAEAPASGGYLSSFWSALSGIVTIRSIGEADWPAIATGAAELAAGGDLAGAIKLVDSAEGEKPVALSQWRDRAAARLALEATLAETEASVQRQLAGTAP